MCTWEEMLTGGDGRVINRRQHSISRQLAPQPSFSLGASVAERVAESGKPVVGGAVGFELLAQHIAWAAPHSAGAQPRGSSILLSRSALYSSRNSRTLVSRPDRRNQ
jgi:hypothetical protein